MAKCTVPVRLAEQTADDLREAHMNWLDALAMFDAADDPAQIEYTAMQVEASRMRYDYLLSAAKRQFAHEGEKIG